MTDDELEQVIRDARFGLPDRQVETLAHAVGMAMDAWLVEHDRKISESAWTRGRMDSIDLKSDAIGFRVVARNADNPFTVTACGNLTKDADA